MQCSMATSFLRHKNMGEGLFSGVACWFTATLAAQPFDFRRHLNCSPIKIFFSYLSLTHHLELGCVRWFRCVVEQNELAILNLLPWIEREICNGAAFIVRRLHDYAIVFCKKHRKCDSFARLLVSIACLVSVFSFSQQHLDHLSILLPRQWNLMKSKLNGVASHRIPSINVCYLSHLKQIQTSQALP